MSRLWNGTSCWTESCLVTRQPLSRLQLQSRGRVDELAQPEKDLSAVLAAQVTLVPARWSNVSVQERALGAAPLLRAASAGPAFSRAFLAHAFQTPRPMRDPQPHPTWDPFSLGDAHF